MENQSAAILVADHSKDSQQSLSQILSAKGYEVVIASDGQAALQILGGRTIDLILLEAHMPNIRGVDVLRAIRGNATIETTPVIILSSSKNDDDIIESFELGANDVINRPFEPAILVARVQAQLRARKRQINRPQSSQSTASNPGVIIAGQYKVEERIGEGGFGAVFRAIRLSDKLPVAVKVLQTSVMPSQKALTRFQIEGITTRRVQHKNAVAVYDSGVTLDGLAFLVMELLRGTPLDKEIKAGPLSAKRAAEIMIPVCEAVAFAHEAKIIHRDIKPSNIFLNQESGVETPKVLDFGLAKIVDESFGENFTREGHILGTVSYVAPERLRTQPYDGRSDIYSLGATLYEMVVGAPPFTTPTPNPAAVAVMHLHDAPASPRSKQPTLVQELDSLILAMLEKDPNNRPSLKEVVERLRPISLGPEVLPVSTTTAAGPGFGTMVLTDLFESDKTNAPVDPHAQTHRQEPAEIELGESSILQVAEQSKVVPPPLANPKPKIEPPKTIPTPAKLPTLVKPQLPVAAKQEPAEIELGESSILQVADLLTKTPPPAPKPTEARAPLVVKPPAPKAPMVPAKPGAESKPASSPKLASAAVMKPPAPSSLKLPSASPIKPSGSLPPPKPLLKPPPPLAKPTDPAKKE